MLVSDIINNGRLLADVPLTNNAFYTQAEALLAVNLSWKDIYAALADGGDDYFTISLYFDNSALIPDPNRQYVYTYDLPTDFYKMRLFQYKGQGGDQFWPLERMNTSNFGNTQNTPSYRIVGKSSTALSNGGQVQIYTNYLPPTFSMWYIPSPQTYLIANILTDDISYPLSMIPEIMAYQVAIEIRRKQNIDYKDKLERRNELMKTMLKQITRDDNRGESVKNVFSNGFGGYV